MQCKSKQNKSNAYAYICRFGYYNMYLNTRLTQSTINVRVWVNAYCCGSRSLVDTNIYRSMLCSTVETVVGLSMLGWHSKYVSSLEFYNGLLGPIPLALILDPFSPLVLYVWVDRDLYHRLSGIWISLWHTWLIKHPYCVFASIDHLENHSLIHRVKSQT